MSLLTLEEKKKIYIDDIYAEMKKRGFTAEEIPAVIGRTGFMTALEAYPEVQLHYATPDAVDEIILVAAKSVVNNNT